MCPRGHICSKEKKCDLEAPINAHKMQIQLYTSYQRLLRQCSKKEVQQNLSFLSQESKKLLIQTVNRLSSLALPELQRIFKELDSLGIQPAHESYPEDLVECFLMGAKKEEIELLANKGRIDATSIFFVSGNRAVLHGRMCFGCCFRWPQDVID